jgi:transcriptional regulator with XRE-family HTH domain
MRAIKRGENMIRAIEDVRKTKGFTQEYVAKAVGVAISSYSQYETGARSVPAEVAEKIADVLGVEVSEIFLPSKFTIRGSAGK